MTTMTKAVKTTIADELLIERIHGLRKTKNAIILAHYYQPVEIQDIADFIGDSLALSQKAASTSADIIVFAGVYFMAETAKILNPNKTVLLPDLASGCTLADSCTAEQLREAKTKYPDHIVVSYINCSAEVKAESDLVCTSANAERIILSVPLDQPILFVPDRHLGEYLIRKTGRAMRLWDGACVVHEAFSIEKILSLYTQHPNAAIVAHPEAERLLLKVASYVGSTQGMINFVRNDPRETFIVGTEAGILHQMQKAVPRKKLIPAPVEDDNSCACSECAFMKLNTLEKILRCLETESPEITVEAIVSTRAYVPIKRMLDLSTIS
jgi:quinolinate synthase